MCEGLLSLTKLGWLIIFVYVAHSTLTRLEVIGDKGPVVWTLLSCC